MSTTKTLSMAMLGAALIALGTTTGSAMAATLFPVFQGNDSGAGFTDPRPKSDAAAAEFDAAAGALGTTVNLITFEDQAVNWSGNDYNLTVAPGVTMKWSNNAYDYLIDEDFAAGRYNPKILGFNTTPGGSKFAKLNAIPNGQPASITFNFDTPIVAWGAYFTGVGTISNNSGQLFVKFDDGSSRSVAIFGNPPEIGGVQFFGFTDPGKSISSVSVTQYNPSQTGTNNIDIFGIDDVRYAASKPVPEPSSALDLLAFSAFGVGLILKCKQQQKKQPTKG